jgi:hypothetical protein
MTSNEKENVPSFKSTEDELEYWKQRYENKFLENY